MPSKKAGTDPDVVYRSEPPLKQKKFPDRRSRVTNSRRSLPAIERQQSTLTQRWLPSSDNVDSADEVEDIEDDDFGEAKPKRKRRKAMPTSGKKDRKSVGKKQNTMTQMGFVTSFGSNVDDDDDDQDQVMYDAPHEDEEDEDRVPESVPSSQALRGKANKSSSNVNPAGSEDGISTEESVGRSPQSPSPELPMMEAWRPILETLLPVEDPRPSTPRKHFPSEIPSSNTPRSAYLFSTQTTQSRSHERSPSKSPLKQRSINIALSSAKTALSPVCETPAKLGESSFSPWSDRKTDIFRKPALPKSKPTPTLVTRTTIPDSEDMPIEETQRAVSFTIHQPQRKLKRVRSTIQDTQYGAFGSEVNEDVETDVELEDYEPENDTYQATMEYTGPYYDTVAEALDRDAARFMQTQRLKDMRRTKFPDFVLDTQDGSNEDLLAARTRLSKSTTSIASRQGIGRFAREQQSNVHEQQEDSLSTHTQSLPATPEKPERSHHRPRFHNVEVVDLTAESFEPIVPTTSGSPTRKAGSEHAVKMQRLVSSPSSKDSHVSSSPPLVPSNANGSMTDRVEVEYLALNDAASKEDYHVPSVQGKPQILSRPLSQAGLIHGFGKEHDLAMLAPSQISTVGHPTQAFLSQRRRTRIKPEPEDLYSATPRITHGISEEVDLDLEDDDENVDIDEEILSDQDLNAEVIEHVDLSDMKDIDEEDSYVDIEEVHERWGIDEREVAKPSSPIPVPPGHSAVEYADVTRSEISSDLPDHLTSPPHDSSEAGYDDRPSSQTSLAAHGMHVGEPEETPRAQKAKSRGISREVLDNDDEPEVEITPRARPPLSEKARGKQPLYVADSLEDEVEERELPHFNKLATDVHEDDGQYSWRFRPANEILPDSQFSIFMPPIPSSDDYTQKAMDERARRSMRESDRQDDQMREYKQRQEDISLAAPPKSSYNWMKRGR